MSVMSRSSRSRAIHGQNFITAIAGYSIILQDFFGARTGEKWLKNGSKTLPVCTSKVVIQSIESWSQGREFFAECLTFGSWQLAMSPNL